MRLRKKAKEDEFGNRTSSAFLAKVSLASPLQSARSFAESWTDLVGSGYASVGRTTIDRVRSAFCEVVKDLYLGEIETAARSRSSALAPDSALALGDASLCGVVLHVHDEASLRLRSKLDSAGPVSRGRSSKVIQHSVWADVGASEPLRFVPTELSALANKKAVVAATSIYKVLEGVARRLEKGFAAGGACARVAGLKAWLVHILVGDGIGTNAAAAKIVLPWAVRDLAFFDYFILVVKCANHQANLAIGDAVTGAAATAAAGNGFAAAAAPNPLVARREVKKASSLTSRCAGWW